jgi:KamA family protein
MRREKIKYEEWPQKQNVSKKKERELLYYFAANDRERKKIDEVMKKYPAKLTPFLEKLAAHSPAIRKQYLPSPEELMTTGSETPFEEGKKTSKTYGLERLYRDRLLLTPHFDCPAYCRFCYKKSRVMRGKRGMTYEEIDKAAEEITHLKDIRGVLVTGGEPLMKLKKLFYLLDKIIQLKNILEIRVGTRTLLTKPEIYTDELCDRLASYIRPNFKKPAKSKYLAINVHFNHPDELAPEVLQACHRLTSRGITLRNQTVLLKGINDDIKTIKRLFSLLIRNNMIPYYFNHCMPVEGSDHLRASVQRGLDIYKYLCTESSTIIPNYVYAPSGGKVHVGPDTKLDYMNINGTRFIKVKLLYKAEEFKRIAKKELPPMHRETEDGFIEGLYLDGSDD